MPSRRIVAISSRNTAGHNISVRNRAGRGDGIRNGRRLNRTTDYHATIAVTVHYSAAHC